MTQIQWETVTGRSIHDHAALADYGDGTAKFVGPNYPMHYISFYEIVEFCNALSRLDGLTPAYSGRGEDIQCNFDANGYRLPTEAEWEYAARGGHLMGEYMSYSGSNNPDEVAWYRNTSGNAMHIIGQKEPNALGLYDMSGNVWESCWDRYGEYPERVTDPLGPTEGHFRIIRGGAYHVERSNCRSATRIQYHSPDSHSGGVGLRLVRTAD